MHIEFVTDTYPPDVNGAAKSIGHMVACLREAGHQVSLIGPHPESGLQVSSIPVPWYPAVRLGLVRKRRLKSWWRQSRPDAVYIAGEAFLGGAALKAASQLGIPTIAAYHTHYGQYARNWHLKLLARPAVRHMRRFHNRASATVVASPSVTTVLEREGFDRLHVIGRGVDTGLFHSSKRSEAQRRRWDADADTPVALFASRVSPEKNLGLLARAFGRMQEVNPKTRCVLVGDGPSFERFERENPNVMCCRFKPSEELATIYASADILVFPSMTETFGNTVTEALASGLVVVAFDDAGAQMHIKHRVNGLLAKYGDEQSFLDACESSLDLAFDHSLRDAAHTSMRAVSWELVAQRIVEIAEGLLPEGQ